MTNPLHAEPDTEHDEHENLVANVRRLLTDSHVNVATMARHIHEYDEEVGTPVATFVALMALGVGGRRPTDQALAEGVGRMLAASEAEAEAESTPTVPCAVGDTIVGPFGPDGYYVQLTEVIDHRADGGDIFVTGIRSDVGTDRCPAENPDGVVSFIFPAERIQVVATAGTAEDAP